MDDIERGMVGRQGRFDHVSEPDMDIVDDSARHRFVLGEGPSTAQLVYRAADDRLVLVHTEVPDELGGRGIAGRLVRAAVDRAAGTGETVVPQCSYARHWLETHPDVAGSISVDWGAPT